METKKVTIQFEHKGSRALEESTIQTSLENIEKLFAECDSELGSMGMDGCGYVSQASQISELYEHIQDLKNYVWSAHQEVYDVLDHPLFLDFSNGVTQALSEIVLANFQTENTIGMEEYVDVTKQGHAITHKEVKKSLGFTDFLGLSEIDPREGLPALENVETVSEFALLFRLDYDIMKEETDVNTAMQGFLTAGEFPHLSYDTETGYISGLLDFTIIVPLTEAITGYNQVTGEKLTGSERGWKVAGAVVDIISLGLGAKFLKAGGYAGKELLKKLGITFLQDTASGVGAYTVAYAASENGASGVDTFLISMLTGTVLSAVMGKPVFDEKILKETPEVVGESTEVVIKGGLDAKVKPSNPYNVDAKPNGTVTKITDKMDEATRRSLIRENEAAETIAKNGYNIEQNPVIDGTTRNPDYLIEGEIFDCYSPAENTKVRNVASTIEEKVIKKGQAERVVLNLDDWKGNVDELVKQLNDYPIEGLKEVIIVYDGTVQSIYP